MSQGSSTPLPVLGWSSKGRWEYLVLPLCALGALVSALGALGCACALSVHLWCSRMPSHGALRCSCAPTVCLPSCGSSRCSTVRLCSHLVLCGAPCSHGASGGALGSLGTVGWDPYLSIWRTLRELQPRCALVLHPTVQGDYTSLGLGCGRFEGAPFFNLPFL